MTVQEQAQKARTAALTLSSATRATKDAALLAMADSSLNPKPRSWRPTHATSRGRGERNQRCLDRQAAADAGQNRGMVDGLGELAALPDPVGDVVRGWTNANGYRSAGPRAVRSRRHHLRGAPQRHRRRWRHLPEVGQCALLRGSSSAAESNAAVVEALQAGLVDAGLPAEAIQLVPGPREVTNELMAARGLVDVLIPRGGAGLIDNVVRNSQVPVIETEWATVRPSTPRPRSRWRSTS